MERLFIAETIRKAVAGTLSLEECNTILDKNIGRIVASEDVNCYVEPTRTGLYASKELPSVTHASTLLAAVAKEYLTNTEVHRAGELRKSTLIHASLLIEQLFNESALPITTINEEETKIIGNLFDKIADAATSEFPDAWLNGDALIWGKKWVYASSEPKEVLISDIQQTRDEFWRDTRMAGQLVYHNTGHLDGVSVSGGLMSRLQQKRELGEMRTTTPRADTRGIHHSVVPHFSETYSPTAYKIGDRTRASFELSGTVAIPLMNVIEVAPFARDAQYATVTVKL